jgi:hypothetical protein
VADEQAPRSSLADEAARLVGSVQEWAQQNFPAGPDGHMGAECQWCPLCQLMAVLRGDHPELTERVTEAGTAVVSAVRALLEAAATTRPSGSDTDASPRVQRIDLGSPE